MVDDHILSPSRIRALTTEFCTEYPSRPAGGPGEAAAAAAVAELMQTAGLQDVVAQELPFELMRARAWDVRTGSGRSIVSRPLLGVPACADLDLEVADVGLGSEEDYARLRSAGVSLEGKAHLARRGGNGPGTAECDRWEKMHSAKQAGAAAFLYAMDVPAGPREWLPAGADAPPPLETGLGDLYPSLPAATIAAFEAEDLDRVRMTIDSTEEPGTTWLVCGTLPGATDEEVILGAQLDAVEWACYGAPYDNGAGIAAILLLGESLARAGGWRRTLTVCAFGAEEAGTLTSRHLAADRMDEPEHVAAMVNFDSWTHRDGWLSLSSFGRGSMGQGDFTRNAPYGGVANTGEEGSLARRLAGHLEAVGYPRDRMYATRRAEWTSDHYPFAIVGVPCVWAFKKPVLFHCEYDTLSAMDWNDASLVARAHERLLEELLQRPGVA